MKISEYSKPALRTAIYFFIFGFFWILLSDKFVHHISATNQIEQQLQTYKGWFFILTTTILIFLVVKQQIKLVIDLKNKLTKSEERYKKIVNMTHDLIWETDAHGKILQINDACAEIMGYTPSELIGKNFYDMVPEGVMKKTQPWFERMVGNNKNYIKLESEVYHRNGSIVYLKDAVNIVRNEHNEVIRLEGASTNITAYKAYEKKLVENQQRLELAMYGGEIGLWEFLISENKLILSEGWHNILGLEVDDEGIGVARIARLIHPDDMPVLQKTFGKPEPNTSTLLTEEIRMMHADGEYRWINAKGKVTKWNADQPARLLGAITDITTKKKMEIELKNLVKLYSSFISYSSEGIYLFEMNEPMPTDLPVEDQIRQLYHNGYIRTCNDAFAKMYGFETGEEMVGTDQETLHGSDSDPANINLLRRFINSGYRIMNDVTKETDKDGNLLYISNNVVGIIENGKLYRTWGSQRNITEQVLTQQKIEESENRYRLLFETNPVPLIIFNQNNLMLRDVNQAMEKLTGFSKHEFLQLRLGDIVTDNHESNMDKLSMTLSGKQSVNIEIDIKSKNGKNIPCEGKFDRINFRGQQAILGAINDLTGIRDAEKMVIQSLIQGADNERLRVAKEIHDGLGQNLTAASLNLNSVLEESDKMDGSWLEKFRNGIKFLKMAIEESRNIAHNLMPKAIVDYGIILSLNSLFNQIEKATDIKIRFYENIGEEVRLDLQTELNLYRITQEAINNVIKHAEASEVFVQLMLHTNEIIYTFEDNGKGFDRMVVSSGKKGIGIKSIYNRAKAMSGYCDIDSSPGDGTTITVVIPIEK